MCTLWRLGKDLFTWGSLAGGSFPVRRQLIDLIFWTRQTAIPVEPAVTKN